MPQQLKIVYYVEPDAAALAAHAAQYFVEQAEHAVAARGRARIAISGGSTPKATFALLADPAQPWRARMPWSKLDLWWVDERCVPPDDPDSNYRMTREAMLDHVPLQPEQIHRMEGELEPEAAAARYESELRNGFRLEGAELPRFDVVQLGMGPDGHTASLFPHTRALHELGRLAVANHVQIQGRLAGDADLAGDQPWIASLLPHRRRGQGADSKRGIYGAARPGAAAQPIDQACRAVY